MVKNETVKILNLHKTKMNWTQPKNMKTKVKPNPNFLCLQRTLTKLKLLNLCISQNLNRTKPHQ